MLEVSGDAKPREIATAKYEFVEEPLPEMAAPEPKAPEKEIAFTATGKNRIFGRIQTSMKIVSYDDSSITCEIPGVAGTIRWTRVDPDRYFIILVARQNEFYDNSGSAFPMVIKLAGGVPENRRCRYLFRPWESRFWHGSSSRPIKTISEKRVGMRK